MATKWSVNNGEPTELVNKDNDMLHAKLRMFENCNASTNLMTSVTHSLITVMAAYSK